jgi:hypothetical protein
MKLIAQLILLMGFILFIGPVAILGFIALWGLTHGIGRMG